MIEKYDHVGMVIRNTDEVLGVFSRLFGFETVEALAETEAGFKSTLISKSDVTLELLEPVGPQGIIQKFMEKKGGGLHHVSIRVSNLEEEMTRLREQGVQFLSETPNQVTDTSKNVFIHPRSAAGLLIELVQRD
ncbi:MAG: MmcG [Acidobacteria bacterium]|nr:MmcG [Acidobacteriota bacterium]